MSEANIHFELHHHLPDLIDDSPHRGTRTYDSAKPEYRNGVNGFADLVTSDTIGSPVLVIEAKRLSGGAVEHTETLVERTDGREVIDLAGVSVIFDCELI